MHHLTPKGSAPKCLRDFCRQNPQCRDWDVFYDNFHDSYEELKAAIASNQGYLCAYCEEKLPPEKPYMHRIEHFHPKEDQSTPHNWAFDWNNMLVTCHGGTRETAGETINLHCDASKEQLVTPTTCDGYLLNPLAMPDACLFSLDLVTGKLKPDENACSNVTIPNNHYGSVQELVAETIRILNLNCDRLNQNRRKVVQEYERQRQNMRSNPRMNRSSIRTAIAQEWFGRGRMPEFYTTRRILLGTYAEDVINTQ